MKVCKKCSSEYISRCKECLKIYQANYYKKNKVKILNRHKEYETENKVKNQEIRSEWYRNNKHYINNYKK